MNPYVKQISRTFILLALFAIAMGFLEGIVVVYLRQVYYPRGFSFPLTLLSPEMLSVEWLREIATIVMLVTIAWIAGKNFLQRTSFFLFVFAVWDIFYYVALKLILDWPSSLITWDILFLIPVPWIGPVLAPVIVSLGMIMVSFLFTFLPAKGKTIVIKPMDWIVIFAGNGIIFYSFISDYLNLIIQSGITSGSDSPEVKAQFWENITSFIPKEYSWFLFSLGTLLVVIAIYCIVRRSYKTNQITASFSVFPDEKF
jgi:hypothetical protein